MIPKKVPGTVHNFDKTKMELVELSGVLETQFRVFPLHGDISVFVSHWSFMRLPYDDQLRVPPICSGIQEKYPIPGESWAELYHALETCHKRAGPHLSLPHDADDDEHTDSTCTLLLCVRGEGKWLLLKKTKWQKKKKKKLRRTSQNCLWTHKNYL